MKFLALAGLGLTHSVWHKLLTVGL